MSGELRVTPPTPGDVLWAAQALGWPALQGACVTLASGEVSWRAYVTAATALDVWEALHALDEDETERADAPDDGEPGAP